MKFWEVVSAFRSHHAVLHDVFSNPEWREPYLDWLHREDYLVRSQDRSILDAFVDVGLTRQIAERIPDLYYFDHRSRNLRADRLGMAESDSFQPMTTLEVHDQFGGAFLEEVREYGSACIPEDV